LLAQKVLGGETKGYRRHPQLERFRAAADPLDALSAYLLPIVAEAERRGYCFNGGKIMRPGASVLLEVPAGQVTFEWSHLLRKLHRRSPGEAAALAGITAPALHPLFRLVSGPIALWERGSEE
jgi:hypothetical protein